MPGFSLGITDLYQQVKARVEYMQGVSWESMVRELARAVELVVGLHSPFSVRVESFYSVPLQ